MSAAIETRSMRKVYQTHFWSKKHVALHGLDLRVERGEIFGFVGPNGAGKTTTIKCLVGLQSVTTGSATLLGKAHTESGARQKLGFLPERPYFYQHLSARELLLFMGQLTGVAGPPARVRIERLLERVDLVRFADVPLSKYSKGMLQRVGLCQALLHDPDLVVLDEPMSGLDPMGRALVRDVILEERAAGRTVFFSSHILHDVETLCDRVAVLVQGRLRGVGTVDELLGDTAAQAEVRIEGTSPEDLPVPPVRIDRGVATCRVPAEGLDALLVAVRAGGGRILEVGRARRTLEDVFLSEVERDRPVDDKTLGVLA
ncbi:MAG: ABC transporter ATP-binding protein [Myxococcota bacterium]|nr:ABC transporter ATP-binding protein [Myxococcota bacterium]